MPMRFAWIFLILFIIVIAGCEEERDSDFCEYHKITDSPFSEYEIFTDEEFAPDDDGDGDIDVLVIIFRDVSAISDSHGDRDADASVYYEQINAPDLRVSINETMEPPAVLSGEGAGCDRFGFMLNIYGLYDNGVEVTFKDITAADVFENEIDSYFTQ